MVLNIPPRIGEFALDQGAVGAVDEASSTKRSSIATQGVGQTKDATMATHVNQALSRRGKGTRSVGWSNLTKPSFELVG